MHPTNRSSGFTLAEMLLALGVIALLALAAFLLFPKIMVRVHADADKRAMSAGYTSFIQLMRAGGASQFNRDPTSSSGPLSDHPEALATMLKPMDCSAPWGWLNCRFASASEGMVDFMSVATCQDDACSSVGPPYKVFSMRVTMRDVPTDACVALVSGMGMHQTDTGASAIYVIGSDWSYKPIFLNTATVPNLVTACQDPSGVNSSIMFDFWPWGDAFHLYPAWGG